jgi:group I intron endonuclease
MAQTLIDEPYLFLGLSSIDEPNILFSIFVPIMIYNADKDKAKILSDNKGKAGIYRWTHKESGKIYIGSAFDLSERIYQYFSLSKLKRVNNHIYNALISHTHSAFSLSILEYIEIANLSKESARKLILEREQFYLDFIFLEDKPNTYNILKVAGSLLGYNHSDKTKTFLSEAFSGENNPMFGKTHSSETKQKMSEAHQGKVKSAEIRAKMSQAKSGDNHPRGMLGKSHSAESLAKMSEAKKGITKSEEHKTKISEALSEKKNASKMVYVYEFNSKTKETILFKELSSCAEAAKFFDCTTRSISNYLDKNKLYKKEWILSSTMK